MRFLSSRCITSESIFIGLTSTLLCVKVNSFSPPNAAAYSSCFPIGSPRRSCPTSYAFSATSCLESNLPESEARTLTRFTATAPEDPNPEPGGTWLPMNMFRPPPLTESSRSVVSAISNGGRGGGGFPLWNTKLLP